MDDSIGRRVHEAADSTTARRALPRKTSWNGSCLAVASSPIDEARSSRPPQESLSNPPPGRRRRRRPGLRDRPRLPRPRRGAEPLRGAAAGPVARHRGTPSHFDILRSPRAPAFGASRAMERRLLGAPACERPPSGRRGATRSEPLLSPSPSRSRCSPAWPSPRCSSHERLVVEAFELPRERP